MSTVDGRRRKAWRLPLTVALAASMALAACGGDDEGASGGESADATEVTVTADEYSFELSATPTAETERVVLDNAGEEPHALIFARINEGFTLDEAFEMQGGKGSADTVAEANAAPGSTGEAAIKGPLEPGEYAMVCPLQTKDGESHFELGQREEFSIE